MKPTRFDCPECGGHQTIELVTDGLVGVPMFINHALRLTWQRRPFAACARCEFCIEVKP